VRKGIITLDNFADWHGEVGGVEIDSNLPFEPYVPAEAIDVHLGRIARAARMSHLNYLAIGAHAESSFSMPGVASVDRDGSATMAMSDSTDRTPRGRSAAEYVAPFMFNKGRGDISINFAQDDFEGNLRDPSLWAKVMDLSIRDQLREAGKKKLLRPADLRVSGFAICTVAGSIGLGILNHNLAAGYTIDVLGMNGLMQAAKHLMPAEAQANDPETTLLPMLPLDRVALTSIYTRTRKLIAAK
jgi:hypothetical protein